MVCRFRVHAAPIICNACSEQIALHIFVDFNANISSFSSDAVFGNIHQMQGDLSHNGFCTFFKTCGNLFGFNFPCTSSSTTTTGA